MKNFSNFANPYQFLMKSMIRNIVFDLGGVVFKIDKYQAIRRFNEAGFVEAAQYLDAFAQVVLPGFAAVT